MAGLVPAIHAALHTPNDVDARDKPGHDEFGATIDPLSQFPRWRRRPAFSRRAPRPSYQDRLPSSDRGHREGRTSTEARGPPAQKMQAAGTTGSAGRPGPPCAMGLRVIRSLPGVRLVSHRRPWDHHPRTWRQHRGAGTLRFRRPAGLVRPRAHARCDPAGHRSPLPTSRDDRDAPLLWRRDAGKHRPDLPDDTRRAPCGRLARRAIGAWEIAPFCISETGPAEARRDRGNRWRPRRVLSAST